MNKCQLIYITRVSFLWFHALTIFFLDCQPNPSYYMCWIRVSFLVAACCVKYTCLLSISRCLYYVIYKRAEPGWGESRHTSFSTLIQGHMLIEGNCRLNPLHKLSGAHSLSLSHPLSPSSSLPSLPPPPLLSTSLSFSLPLSPYANVVEVKELRNK